MEFYTVAQLPYVMRFNLPERIATFARIAELLGEDLLQILKSAF